MTTEKSWLMMKNQTDKEHERVGLDKWGATHRKELFVIWRLESTDGWRRVTNADDRVDREGWTVMISRNDAGDVEKKTG